MLPEDGKYTIGKGGVVLDHEGEVVRDPKTEEPLRLVDPRVPPSKYAAQLDPMLPDRSMVDVLKYRNEQLEKLSLAEASVPWRTQQKLA